jgi:gentisate 1,2-dioxygenase
MNTRDKHATLGSMDELPADYLKTLESQNLVPLWPLLRAALPFDDPNTNTRPILWTWAAIRPLLLKAGEYTPMEKAERRVLALSNPGRGLLNMQATAGMYLGMQLVLPGEVAPNHRHTPNAVRIVVEGEGGYTAVEGGRYPMEHGDLILTPTGLWHEHHHEGSGPLVWLDVLDLPMIAALDACYAIAGVPQAPRTIPNAYSTGGVAPVTAGHRNAERYPMLRFEWKKVAPALKALAETTPQGHAVQLSYVNPETGGDVLNTLAFSSLMVRPGEEVALTRISPSRILHVIDGDGHADVNGTSLALTRADTFCVPNFGRVRLANRSSKKPLFLIEANESPVHRKLGLYEERG